MKKNKNSINKKMNQYVLTVCILVGLAMTSMSFAQTESTPTPESQTTENTPTELSDEEMKAQIAEVMKKLNPQTGEVILQSGAIKLALGENYYFLDSAAAKTVLVDLWGNIDDGTKVLGMIFPKKYTPLDNQGWGATLEFIEEGYVSDEEASEIDYDDLLKDMKEGTDEANKERVKAGYGSISLVGWAEPPHYDSATNKLYWGKNIKFSQAESNTLNYNIRVLGRKGYLVVNFIADMSQLPEINASREEVLALTEFTEGNRYADFDSSTDNVAKYGIAALVAGVAAKKAGLFVVLLLLLKKFGIFILIGIGAIFSKFRRK